MVTKKNKLKALVAVLSLSVASLVGSAVVPSAANAATLKNVKIAFLLPQNGVPRFEQLDKPYFEKQIKKFECNMEKKTLKIYYHYADGKITSKDVEFDRDWVITNSKGSDDKQEESNFEQQQ